MIEVSPPDGRPFLLLSPRAAEEHGRAVPEQLPHSPVGVRHGSRR
jgi:hypothetical protein